MAKLWPILLLLLFCIISCDNSNPTKTEPKPPDNEIQRDTSIVDLSQQHQVIRGFGAANIVGWRPDMTDADIDKAFGTGQGQLGFSILRLRIPPDENQFNMNVPTAKAAYSAGVKIIATPWTPPPAMKTNNDPVGGRLQDDMYDEYAAYLNSFNTFMEDNGVSLYAISVQNEPDIEVDYESCDWSPAEMEKFMEENASSIETRVMAPESFQFKKPISDAILNNPDAAENLDIVGGHIYGGGLEPYPLAKANNKEVWMTEHLDTDITYSAVLATGKEIHDSLVKANFNAYIWWYIKRFYGPIGEDGQITKRGYIMSNFSRFIRPGYHRVEAESNPDLNMYVSAYRGDDKLVVVAINMGTDTIDQQIVLKNSSRSFGSFSAYVTSGTKDMQKQGTVSVSSEQSAFSFEITGKSITTFVEQ